jgi:hypothetical protein
MAVIMGMIIIARMLLRPGSQAEGGPWKKVEI